ncbi:MAG: KamA family radical SAM protein [Spirochaetaceae bacterium]|nr:MAG: KamA family radical SAM protein [Spirochaetaceae bacterium]
METEQRCTTEEDEPPDLRTNPPKATFLESELNEDVEVGPTRSDQPLSDIRIERGSQRRTRRERFAFHQSSFPFDEDYPAVVPESSRLIHKFPISPDSERFRRTFFADASVTEWNDWHWQLRHRIRRLEQLTPMLDLTMDEMTAILRHKGTLPLAITPYYAGLLDPADSNQPLRRTVVPVNDEYLRSAGEAEDPLAEEDDSPIPGLVHRYPDRVLFLVTNFCSTNCRYCTRSRMVGAEHGQAGLRQRWQRAIEYIENNPQVRDVLLSGGDPLTLSDEKLEWLLGRLRKISHVELIRIGTKVPVVLPQRITPALVRILKRYHPLWMSIHYTHPQELTLETATACSRLADSGIPLGSQTVLLAGINDSVETMKALMHGLLRLRVKPYYLYQCDPILGSAHFRTSVEKGLEIIAGLRGHTSGYAVPTYVIDAPGGGGKIPLLPEYVVDREGEDLILRNYEGRIFRYPDSAANAEGIVVSGQVEGSRAGA